MITTHIFLKRPTYKNLKKRSISFQRDEYSLVNDSDLVKIEVDALSHTIELTLDGAAFKRKCTKLSKYNKTFYVLKF